MKEWKIYPRPRLILTAVLCLSFSLTLTTLPCPAATIYDAPLTYPDSGYLYGPDGAADGLSENFNDASGSRPATTSNREETASFPGMMIIAVSPEINKELKCLADENCRIKYPGQFLSSAPGILMEKYGVRSLEAVFKRHYRLSLKGKDPAEICRKRFSVRARRAPGGIDPPDLSGVYLVRAEGLNIDAAVKDFADAKGILFAEPAGRTIREFIPGDPEWGGHEQKEWALERIGCDQAWDITTGREDVTIAIIEGGLDIDHPELSDSIWINRDEIPGNGIDDDDNGYIDDWRGIKFSYDYDEELLSYSGVLPDDDHGTSVAGVAGAAGDNGINLCGVAWGCRLMAALDGGWSPSCAAAILYAVDNGADVINMSWGHRRPAEYGIIDLVLLYAASMGCVNVTSAGNTNTETIALSPANNPHVITVAATDADDKKAYISSYGVKIDVAAPGLMVYCCDGMRSGTSMAAPFVSGLTALIISRNLDLHEESPAAHPILTTEEIRQIIRTSADDIEYPLRGGGHFPGFDIYTGYGRINAYRALRRTGYGTHCEAKILSPLSNHFLTESDFKQLGMRYFNGWRVVGDSVSVPVIGIARGEYFSRWILEIGRGYHPERWHYVAGGASPSPETSSSLFSRLEGPLIADGVNVLRLRAFRRSGGTREEVYEDRVMINSGRALICSIPRPDPALQKEPALLREPIAITGFAGGDDFRACYLSYGRGEAPERWFRVPGSWSASGIYGGTIVDGFDLDSDFNGTVSLKLTAETATGRTAEDTLIIENDKIPCPVQIGYPKSYATEHVTGFTAPVTADLNRSDASRDILIGMTVQQDGINRHCYRAYDCAGSELFRISGEEGTSSSYPCRPAGGNIFGGDEEMEICTLTVRNSETGNRDTLLVDILNREGNPFPGGMAMEIPLHSTIASIQTNLFPALSDLDNDGLDEIIFSTNVGEDNIPTVFALNGDGTAAEGWPEGGLELIDEYGVAHRPVRQPLIEDLDGDGLTEIVIVTDRDLFLLNHRGEITAEYDLRENDISQSGSKMIRAADLDGDGSREIVLLINENYFFDDFLMMVFDPGLELIREHLISHYSNYWEVETGTDFSHADLDGDGSEELIIRTSRTSTQEAIIRVLSGDGTDYPGWPHRENPSINGSILVTDISGDGEPEIIVGRHDQKRKVNAFTIDGREFKNDYWPIRTPSRDCGCGTPPLRPVSDDLDGDGDPEIILAEQIECGSQLRVWDIPPGGGSPPTFDLIELYDPPELNVPPREPRIDGINTGMDPVWGFESFHRIDGVEVQAGDGTMSYPEAYYPMPGEERVKITLRAGDWQTVDDNGTVSVEMEGFPSAPGPGLPSLPSRLYRIAIPSDTIPVGYEIREERSGVHSFRGNWKTRPAEIKIINPDQCDPEKPFPGSPLTYLGCSRRGPYRYVNLRFTPVRVRAAAHEFQVIEELTVELKCLPDDGEDDAWRTSWDWIPAEEAREYFDNGDAPGVIEDGFDIAEGLRQIPEETYDFVIVCGETFLRGEGEEIINDFADYKESQGHSVKILTEVDCGGSPDTRPAFRAESVHDYLKSVYSDWGIEYVMIISGYDEYPVNCASIPMLNILLHPDIGRTPTDWYYADLDGEWDLNGDGIQGGWPEDFGEGGIDLYAEVKVGRIIFEDAAGLRKTLGRIMDYESTPPPRRGEGSWRYNILQLGGSLRCNSGGDIRYCGSMIQEFVFRNTILWDEDFNSFKMYDPGNEWTGPSPNIAESDADLGLRNVIMEQILSDYGLILAASHGSYGSLCRELRGSGGETIGEDYMTTESIGTVADRRAGLSGVEKPPVILASACLTAAPRPDSLAVSCLKDYAVNYIGFTVEGTYTSPEDDAFSRDDLLRGGDELVLKCAADKLILERLPVGDAMAAAAREYYETIAGSWALDRNAIKSILTFAQYGDPSLDIYSNNSLWHPDYRGRFIPDRFAIPEIFSTAPPLDLRDAVITNPDIGEDQRSRIEEILKTKHRPLPTFVLDIDKDGRKEWTVLIDAERSGTALVFNSAEEGLTYRGQLRFTQEDTRNILSRLKTSPPTPGNGCTYKY